MIYKHPDLDAAVSITQRADVVQLDFLAKGRSQKRAGGKVVGYAKRNPDRRQLVEHVLATLPDVPHVVCIGAQGGAGGGQYERVADESQARAAYSRAGNFRWRLFVSAGVTVSWLAAEVGLEPTDHRPVETTWPAELGD